MNMVSNINCSLDYNNNIQHHLSPDVSHFCNVIAFMITISIVMIMISIIMIMSLTIIIITIEIQLTITIAGVGVEYDHSSNHKPWKSVIHNQVLHDHNP